MKTTVARYLAIAFTVFFLTSIFQNCGQMNGGGDGNLSASSLDPNYVGLLGPTALSSAQLQVFAPACATIADISAPAQNMNCLTLYVDPNVGAKGNGLSKATSTNDLAIAVNNANIFLSGVSPSNYSLVIRINSPNLVGSLPSTPYSTFVIAAPY